MKENKRCEHEMLNLHTRRVYADNDECERVTTAACRFRSLCLSLYERFTENLESDEWNETEELEENDDYCFCSDASWEDRQI